MARPKGSKNYKTEQWERFANWMLSEGLERFESEMKKLKGKDYVTTVKDMMEYFQPKLARTESHTIVEDISDLSEDQKKRLSKRWNG